MERHALTDAQWERLRPLPPPPQSRGRPRRDDRTIVEGILWQLATGVPWRDLPERFGSWRTVVLPLPPLATGRGLGARAGRAPG